jgi:hypothetical protein
MLTPISTQDAHAWILEHLKQRLDMGLRNAFLNLALEPRNPFDPGLRRQLRPGFALFGLGLTVFTLVVVYFEIVPWLSRP